MDGWMDGWMDAFERNATRLSTNFVRRFVIFGGLVARLIKFLSPFSSWSKKVRAGTYTSTREVKQIIFITVGRIKKKGRKKEKTEYFYSGGLSFLNATT